MNRQNITLIYFGYFEKSFLEKLAGSLKQLFVLDVIIIEGRIDLTQFYDPGRRQYDGNKLLKHVDSLTSEKSLKILGLFSIDVFIPILTYIFGQAYLNGHSGIVSLYRLKNEMYGMKQDNNLLVDRFRKTCIHELGHAFGLIHCHNPTCVMRSSTYVEDIDQKNQFFCPKCRTDLGLNLYNG